MRLLLLLLLVGAILADEKATKPTDNKQIIDTKDVKKTIEEPKKSKTEKRDSSDQTASFALNPNDEPFRPIIGRGNADIYEAAAATQQATFYDKTQLTSSKDGGSSAARQHQKLQHKFAAHDGLTTKDAAIINRQAATSTGYQRPYSQAYQQSSSPASVTSAQQQSAQQLSAAAAAAAAQLSSQEQQLKQYVRLVEKNNGQQQKDASFATASAQQQHHPHHHHNNVPAYNYESVPVEYLQKILQQHLQTQSNVERGPQPKQRNTYIIAIPMSYLRQLQQQQQSQYQQSHLQPHNGHQQQTPQLHAFAIQPGYSLGAGPLARDHHGTYRPVHRFAPIAINELQASIAAAAASGHQQQQQHHHHQQAHQSASPTPGYITQYIQVPASALLAAAQAAQVYARPSAPVQASPPQPQQIVYQQQQPQPHPPQPQESSQPQYYYYPSTPQAQSQQPLNHPSQTGSPHAVAAPAAPPPVYAYQIQQQPQPQAIAVEHQAPPVQTIQYIQPEQVQQQPLHVGKQPVQVIAAPQQQPQTVHQVAHPHVAQSPQEQAQVVTVPQVQPVPEQQQQQHAQPIVHYNPQYVQYVQPQAQGPRQITTKIQQQPQLQVQHVHVQPQAPPPPPPPPHLHYHHHPQHRFQLQPIAAPAPTAQPPPPPPPSHPQQQQPAAPTAPTQLHPALVQNINNLPYSQGPTQVPITRLVPPPLAGLPGPLHIPAPPLTPYYQHPFVSGALQPAFTPLGVPSKVTSFTNVLLQPFGPGHTYQTSPEIGALSNGLPYYNQQTGGVQYSSHLYHPIHPIHAAHGIVNKIPIPAAAASPSSTEEKAASPAKPAAQQATEGSSRTIVKYP
ncbi:uncharacterized protein LOC142230640 [Haematobia irritans]|uniref:uncharacterized protein LOC142230640 n=1 Tax=Haematobia irritans TaxID=7368 RepID=UPI003F4F4EB7